MQQPEVKPYVLIAIIILAIVMAFGVFLTVMYLQRRPPDNSYVVIVDGEEVVVNPAPESAVIIVPQEGQGGGEAVIVEPQVEQPETQIVLTNTPEPPPPATPVPPTAVPDISMYAFATHTVTGNDTLYSLAQQYSTSIALMARFGISSTEMVVGNVLSIPYGNSAYCPGYQPYVVIEGDTPFGISSSVGITLEQFGQINNLDANYAIYETQVVCIP